MPPISGKNDLARMQVTNCQINASKTLSHPHSHPIAIASWECASFYISISGWSPLCVQRCRVHKGRLGRDTKCWVQPKEGEGGQSWKIWHRLQLSLPFDRFPPYFFRSYLTFTSLDCPWILSGTKLLMMDPTLQHLDRHTRMWDFTKVEHRKDWEDWEDMRAPWAQMLLILGLPNVFKGEHLAGTLFRLPLRNKASPIQQASDKLYSCR